MPLSEDRTITPPDRVRNTNYLEFFLKFIPY